MALLCLSILVANRRLSFLLHKNCRDIAFAPNGDYHREMKKICVLELLNPKRVQSVGSIREEEVASLIDSINELSFSSTPVDLSEKTMSLSANITCREAFGKSFRDRGNFQDIIHEAFVLLGSFYAADFFPYVGWIVDRLTGLHSRLERSFKELDGFLQQVIDDHIYAKKTKQEQDYEDIVDVLLKLAENGIKSHAIHITQDHIKGILMDLFLAGIDTSAITLVWAMTELVRKPRIMKKAQEEIRAVVGEADKVSESDLDHFEYLKMVVKETLRLHPPGPLLIPRETISDINLNGYHIPSKTRMQINAWAIARDFETWENPLEFIPERFMDNHIDFKGGNYEFLPFGAGRRQCPGMALAVARVELALANLLYCFDWKLPEGMKVEDINMEEVFGLATYKKVPLLLAPCPVVCNRTILFRRSPQLPNFDLLQALCVPQSICLHSGFHASGCTLNTKGLVADIHTLNTSKNLSFSLQLPAYLLSIATFLILLLLPLFVLFKHKSTNQLPPGPPRLPIIGNLRQLGELLSQLSKKFGPVMLLRLGGVPMVIISSAQA